MAKDAKHFFIGLFATCISSFMHCLSSAFAYSFRGLLILQEVHFFELPLYSGH
jgi:hypothetical protein